MLEAYDGDTGELNVGSDNINDFSPCVKVSLFFCPTDGHTRTSPDLDMTVDIKEECVAATTSSVPSDGKNIFPLVPCRPLSWSWNEGGVVVRYGILTKC